MAYLSRIFFVYFALLTIALAIGASATSYYFVNAVGEPLNASTSALIIVIAGYVAAIPATAAHMLAEYVADILG